MRASETAELIFQECIIPDENRLGAVGEGFIQAMKILDGGRISIGALSLGIAKELYKQLSNIPKNVLSLENLLSPSKLLDSSLPSSLLK